MSMIADAARLNQGAISIVYRPALDNSGNRLRGLYVASRGTRDLCVSSNPFVAAANILLNEGIDPETLVAGRPVELHYDFVAMPVGRAANWQAKDFGNVVRLFHKKNDVINPTGGGAA
jgi:hypothetical protein